MRAGQVMMHAGRAVRLTFVPSDGGMVSVHYLSSNKLGKVPQQELYEPSEPDAALRYATGLTPGRVPQ